MIDIRKNDNAKVRKYAKPRKSAPPPATLAPSKYNGGQLYATPDQEAKYCINVDWFEATVRGNILHPETEQAPGELLFDGGGLRLELITGGGTKHYRFKYNVYAGGDSDPFAMLITCPRPGGVLDSNFSQIRVLNHALYCQGWTDKLRYALGALDVQTNNVTRLDIAIDGAGFLGFYQAFLKKKYQKIGKVMHTAYHDTKDKMTGFDWGKRASEKILIGYRKSETLEKENKQYILDFWLQNGLVKERVVDNSTEKKRKENKEGAAQIERLELRLKTKAIKRLKDPVTKKKGVSLDRLEDTKYLAGIFKTETANWFEFTRPKRDSNATRRKQAATISPINWQALEACDMVRLSKTNKPNEVWQAKRATSKILKDSDQAYLSEGLTKYFANSPHRQNPADIIRELPQALAWTMADRYNIVPWLERKVDFMFGYGDRFRATRAGDAIISDQGRALVAATS